jgi:hypothetical protein
MNRPMPGRPPVAIVIALTAMAVLPGLFRGRKRFEGHGRELSTYRKAVLSYTGSIDGILADMSDVVDRLRTRDVEIDEAIDRLAAGEEELDAITGEMQEMSAPEELHSLHIEYELNLERALRGIVTAERGCGLTRQRHRPPEDDEPFAYWKRAQANIVHARMRMQEIAEVLLAWEPGLPAVADVSARVHRPTRAQQS